MEERDRCWLSNIIRESAERSSKRSKELGEYLLSEINWRLDDIIKLKTVYDINNSSNKS